MRAGSSAYVALALVCVRPKEPCELAGLGARPQVLRAGPSACPSPPHMLSDPGPNLHGLTGRGLRPNMLLVGDLARPIPPDAAARLVDPQAHNKAMARLSFGQGTSGPSQCLGQREGYSVRGRVSRILIVWSTTMIRPVPNPFFLCQIASKAYTPCQIAS